MKAVVFGLALVWHWALSMCDGNGGRRREIGHGSLGLGAVSALTHRARRIAGRADVLRDRRTNTRQAVVECGRKE
jgi:hypothetical protein